MIAITNAKFYRGSQLVTGEHVLIENGLIQSVDAHALPADCEVIDAEGHYLLPGLIELQIYGSGGNLVSAYPEVKTLRQMDRDLVSKGITSFLACLATNSLEVFYKAIDAAKTYRSEAIGFMGLHLEGPYLNPKRRGAHVEAFIHKATLKEVQALIEYADGTVKMMTLAAELQDQEVIDYLVSNGVVLSLGHSDASFEQAMSAFGAGFTTTTHLFNAMPSIHHRAPNLPVAVLNHPQAMASIIADGLHVDFEVVRMSHKLMGDRLFLISDAVTECAIGPYQHRLNGDKFVTADGTLSGSNITLVDAIRNCVRFCGIALPDAIKMASENPARLIGVSSTLGKIEKGMCANLIMLNDDLTLSRSFIGGVEHLIANN